MYKFTYKLIMFITMLRDQCISVTDLRMHTKNCLQNLSEGVKYVFVNNRPVAVIMDIDMYEDNFVETTVKELPKKTITKELKMLAKETADMSTDDFIDI